eukprot:CAMPEP_0167797732 /NCGR_PEP_ID=MMETSP0111_2-20121227/15844_1 /TAXON_ID=91324 /ORGANISM="Lotharella globosa, Strain CCCM811" /LENGTH=95 /DNA_ID=CAMNT_0007691923 /DNA_START=222 /DNA_END=509 /DNA_ORIENTATION=-
MAKKESKLMKDRGIEDIVVFGRKCFVPVIEEFRRLREAHINSQTGGHYMLTRQSGIGKSLAFSQTSLREAFKQRGKVACFSVQERIIHLFWMEGR